MNFNNKTVLITGGSRGIGKATALAFAKAGATVGINYKSNTAKAQETLQALAGSGHQLFKYDIADKQAQQDLIADFVDTYGRIDVLINNAGISIPHDIEAVDFDTWATAWEQTLNTNLFAAANLSYLAAQADDANRRRPYCERLF